jgi:hypothetical protein
MQALGLPVGPRSLVMGKLAALTIHDEGESLELPHMEEKENRLGQSQFAELPNQNCAVLGTPYRRRESHTLSHVRLAGNTISEDRHLVPFEVGFKLSCLVAVAEGSVENLSVPLIGGKRLRP